MTSKHIEVPVIEGTRTTIPVDEAKRLAASEIILDIADEQDAYKIVHHLSTIHSPIQPLTLARPKAYTPVSHKNQ